jgi:hypothetical protein
MVANVPMAPLMRFARLLLPCLFAGAVQTFAAQLGPPPAYTIPPSLELPPGTKIPSDAELMTSKAHIGRIEIDVMNVFDLDNPEDNNWLYRLADRLHIPTRTSAIRALLLFQSGQLYDPRLLAETARNIRQNSGFMREPLVRPYRYHDGLVDIQVIVHDVWTLQPGVNFSRSGGANAWGFDLKDSNIFGSGKSFEIGHSKDVDRSSTFVNWSDPNVFGTRWTDSVQYSHNSDGTVWGAGISYPFYSLESPYAAGLDAGNAHSVVQRYRLGDRYDAYGNDWRTGDFFAANTMLMNDRWTDRLMLGWRVDDSTFYEAPGHVLLAPLPADRLLSYPFVRMQWTRNRYQTVDNLALIARTEDVHMGLDASVGVGYATPLFGADRDSLIVDTEIGDAWQFGHRQQLFVGGRASTRVEYGAFHDAIAMGSAQYYFATSDHTRFFTSLNADVGHNLDGDHYFDLGGDTGLRGYPLRYQSGDQLVLWTVEERLYTNWYPFRLFNVGAAAFFDLGRTWGTTLVPTPQLGYLKDAGFGLRLGNARSAFGSVIHIDLAFPLDREYNITRMQFLITTEASY